MYIPDTAVLVTRFLTDGGVAEVLDFFPAGELRLHRLVRMVHCVRGEVSLDVEVSPRFDYGRRALRTDIAQHGAVFDAGGERLTLHVVREPGAAQPAEPQRSADGDVRMTVPMTAGQVRGVVLEWGDAEQPHEVTPAEVRRLFEGTVRFWRDWLARSTYRGRWREMVDRAAITLQLMTYAPSGRLIASPTAGRPEQVGGERNWDYRYTCVRDGSFSVYSLLALGFIAEAPPSQAGSATASRSASPAAAARCASCTASTAPPTCRGDARPLGGVPRVASRADRQRRRPLQLDIYGEALDSTAHGHAACGHNMGSRT